MAEARAAVMSPFGVSSSEGEIVLRINKDAIPALVRATRKVVARARNAVINSIFPAKPVQWVFSVASPAAILLFPNHQYLSPYSSLLTKFGSYIPGIRSFSPNGQIALISAVTGTGIFLTASFLRRVCLRLLLSYRGWLYEAPRQQSFSTTAWAVCVRIFTGSHALTYGFQNSIPSLPVPRLRQTCARYLRSVAGIQSTEELARSQALVDQFLANEGPRLQRYLMLKWLTTSNYVSDWWEKYVYLRGRSSIMVNSNYYVLDAFTYMPCTNQLARAALFISNILKFKRDLDREEIEPITIRDTVPLCMAQYERLFTTTRIPGKECDTLEHHDYSSYIVVLRKGRYYQLSVYNRKGQILAPFEFENHLHWIVEDADRGDSASYEEEHLAAFTAEERHVWAAVRSEHFASGVNKESLDIIDKAIFVLSLDTETPKDLSSRGKALLHGNGYNRWFDKSFTLVLFPDGRAGLNCEHSWADAPVVAHMWEWVMCHETEDAYDEHGHNIRPESTTPRVATAAPHKLAWDFSPKLSEAIKTAVAKATTIINDLDLSILHHSKYGKDYMKHAKISPDAYVQMALQLAYYHDSNGETPLTYESSMTRLYKQGRTETVRPASVDAREFVRAMVNPSVTKEQRIQLLRKAGETHQNLYRDAMSGKGIDRHLFALYVVSQGLGVDSPFLKDALSRAWKLSTSQQPQQQTKLWEPEGKDRHKIGPGGGFGPVADDGYGTSYMFAGSHCLFAHVSSKISAKNTDSARFANNLERAFEELAALFR